MDEMDNCSNALNNHFDDDPDDIDSDYSKCVHKGTNYVPISSKSSNELSQSTSSSIDSSCDSDYYPLNHRIQTNGVGRHNSDYVNTGSPHATQQEPQLPPTPTPPPPPPPIYANLPLTGSIASAVNSSATSTVNYPPHHQSPFHRRNHSLNHRFNHKIIINNNNNNNNYHHQHHKNHYHNVITTSSSSSSSSSSYPSSPLSTTCSPPIPETGTDPNRVLLNHWSEYIHLSGRKYYYNSVTKQSSWKPPRRGLPIFRDEEENTSHSEENLTDSSSANSWSPTSNCRDNLSISSDFSSNLNTNSTVNSVYSHRLKPRVRPRKTILGNLWQFDNNKNVDSNTSPYSVPQHRYHLHQQSRTNGHHKYADEDSKDTLDQHHHQYHPSFHHHHHHHLHNHQHNNAHHHRHHHHQRHNSQDENNPPPPPVPPLLPHHHDTWSSPLPTGWTRYINDNQVYFVNEVTKVKSDKEWQSQSDASECYSPITKDIPEDSNDNSASSFSPAPSVLRFKNDGSLRLPMRKHCYVNGLAPIDRSYRAKSMVFLPTGDKFVNIDSDSEERSSTTTMTAAITTASATSTINKTHSNRNTTAINSSISNNHVNHSLNSHHTHGSHHAKIPPVPENLEESRAFKTGILNRTKIMENGKRLRKNWSTSLVALSDHYLLIFKDAKISSHQEENLKPEIAVELGGSLIEWSQGLSSRKNVFQLTTFTGNQILLQEDCSLTAAEWFYSIKSAISKLPKCDGTATIGSNSLETNKECKLKRSKSTKQTYKKPEINQKLNHSKNGGGGGGGPGEDKITPEKKKKIRERLINFLLRRPTLDSLREKGIFKDGPVFGCDLYSLCSREKQLVPKVVQQCIKAIEQKGLKADGIYRVCGNLSEVQKIRYQVNHDDYEGIWAQEDVHVLTGALKLFFRDMKEPLFPCNRFDSLMFTIGLPDKKKKQEAIVRVIRDLPKCNKETLKFLLKHLLRVQDHKDENRMHIQNLAIVFGPTLMWPETDSNNLAYDMMLKMHSNQVIELLLLEFDNIFR